LEAKKFVLLPLSNHFFAAKRKHLKAVLIVTFQMLLKKFANITSSKDYEVLFLYIATVDNIPFFWNCNG